MKLAGKILICLVGGLVWNTNVRAEDVVLPGNPYAPVVVRNIFGLNPPPPPVDTSADNAPPPKITVNGIMTILGQLQVLFKVAYPAGGPGKPGGDTDYILSEGERQDDIEVVKIDKDAGLVTFVNHGDVEELPLATATASTGPAPASSFPTTPGGGRGFGNNFGNRGGGNVNGTFGGGVRAYGNNGGNSGFNGGNSSGVNGGYNPNGTGNGGLSFGNNSTGNTYEPPPNNMSVEESDTVIEVNRELTKQQVLEGSMPALPPTEATPPDATGPGGGPLVMPPPDPPK